MSTPKTPPFKAKGLYTLNPPFDQLLKANTLYTCAAIRSFSDLTDQGVDIFATYYQPLGLTQTNYQNDAAAGANIVSLVSDTATSIHLPDTYIVAYPDQGNVAYNQVVIAASLGPLLDGLDLTNLTQKVQNVISDVIGLAPTVSVWEIPSTDVVTQAQSDAAEAARQAAITDRTSVYAQLLALQGQYTTLQEQYNALVQKAIAGGWITPGS